MVSCSTLVVSCSNYISLVVFCSACATLVVSCFAGTSVVPYSAGDPMVSRPTSTSWSWPSIPPHSALHRHLPHVLPIKGPLSIMFCLSVLFYFVFVHVFSVPCYIPDCLHLCLVSLLAPVCVYSPLCFLCLLSGVVLSWYLRGFPVKT